MPETQNIHTQTWVKNLMACVSYSDFKNALACSACQGCDLAQSRTHLVIDRGNPAAKILVIGEAPGKNEDQQQRAFVGAAGKTFDKLCATAGLNSDQDFLICNTVKCRPPQNRRPKMQELAACRPFLEKQIAHVNPRLIVLMGATALQAMDAQKKISMRDQAGKIFSIVVNQTTYPAMVLYHPAALIYNRSLAATMQNHLHKLKEIATGLGDH